MKRTPLRQFTRALYASPVAWGLLAGCQGLTTLPLVEPVRLETADEPRVLPAPASSLTLGPGKTAPTQDHLAQPTPVTSPTDSTPSAAPGKATGKQLLAQAAARLDVEDHASAAIYLQRYLRDNPQATIVRLQLGELYFRMKRWEEARHQFVTALQSADDAGELPVRYLLHGHSRLLDIAAERGDTFEEALHRGIGLVLLAEKRQQEAGQVDVPPADLFAKARVALQSASKSRPADGRPHLYLVPVWLDLQQASNAQLALARAQSLCLVTLLSPSESARLARYGVELHKD